MIRSADIIVDNSVSVAAIWRVDSFDDGIDIWSDCVILEGRPFDWWLFDYSIDIHLTPFDDDVPVTLLVASFHSIN